MANICFYSCKITGSKKGVQRFINAANARYTVGTPDEPEHFWRVFDCYIVYFNEIEPNIYEALIEGGCAWSVSACFLPDGYDRDITSKNNGITATKISGEEGLIVEFYSCEVGCEFSEHYLIVKGEMEVEHYSDYYEYTKENTVQELNKASGRRWHQDKWDNFFKTCDTFIVCDHDFVMEDHLHYYKER